MRHLCLKLEIRHQCLKSGIRHWCPKLEIGHQSLHLKHHLQCPKPDTGVKNRTLEAKEADVSPNPLFTKSPRMLFDDKFVLLLILTYLILYSFISQPIITMQEVAAGLALTPKEQVVTIKNSPVLGITFSQFRATVTGTVKCIGRLLLTCR